MQIIVFQMLMNPIILFFAVFCLYFSVNNIITLTDFAGCSKLEELYLRKNNIWNISELYHLQSLPKLRILWLEGNPCSTTDNYRLEVLRLLPGLQKLDNQGTLILP